MQVHKLRVSDVLHEDREIDGLLQITKQATKTMMWKTSEAPTDRREGMKGKDAEISVLKMKRRCKKRTYLAKQREGPNPDEFNFSTRTDGRKAQNHDEECKNKFLH